MNLYIQMGHGMQKMCTDLCKAWNGATVILSPKHICPTEKLISFASSFRKLNGKVLFDSQLYSPRKHHDKLKQHVYWPKSGITSLEMGDWQDLLATLANINAEIKSEYFILPSNIAIKADDLWGKIQAAIIDQARQVANGQKLMLTVALGKDVLGDEAQTENIVHIADQWDVEGIYIVCEHPERYYLVDKPIWVTNLLSLVAGLKRQGKTVIVGYANHQLLPLALSKCDAIAAGGYLNVRWFQPESFETSDSAEPSRRALWYYYPQALSEYKVAYLDIAHRNGMLKSMMPPPAMMNDYSKVLFAGALPSSTNYKEGNSFKHYLHCLKIQCETASKSSYNATRDAQFVQLETAARIIDGLYAERIRGQNRDFIEITDVNEASIHSFDKDYGFAMSQEWDVL